MFVGSLAGESSIPFLCAYSSSKGFLKRTACILYEEERALHSSNLSFMYLNVGEVRSSTLAGEPSFARPLADEFAKGVVRSLGCGRRVVVP
jgi:short-subunit dehydrogenase